MRRVRKALAASFVVTVVGGCDSKPSQPAATPTVDVGSAPAAANAPAAAAPSSGAPVTADSVAALPLAPSTGHVVRADDGTCTWFPDRPPPPRGGRVMLNPPPPHAVQCPPGDGGT